MSPFEFTYQVMGLNLPVIVIWYSLNYFIIHMNRVCYSKQPSLLTNEPSNIFLWHIFFRDHHWGWAMGWWWTIRWAVPCRSPLGVSPRLPLWPFFQESWQSYYSTASSSIQNNYSCHLVCLSRTVALWSRRTKNTAQSVKSGWNRRISQSTILWIPTDLWIIADIFPKFKYNVKNEEKDRWRLWAYYPDSRKRFYPSSNFLENLHENSYETLSRRL